VVFACAETRSPDALAARPSAARLDRADSRVAPEDSEPPGARLGNSGLTWELAPKTLSAPLASLAVWVVRQAGRYAPRVFITFLSDFGLTDDFVGTCHGVMKRIAPTAEIIDITHGIPPQAVLQGALVLANTVGYMPIGVHLAVVDPGVGGPRRPLALLDREGRLFVGPDNGLLLPAASRAGIASVRELANPAYALETISRTFHARDLFAPAAAHLSNGVALEDLGPPLAADGLVDLDLPRPELSEGTIVATILYVDSFGNIALNLTRDDVERIGIVSGTRVELEHAGERYYAVMARTFADARPGDVILYEDSYRNVSVAISRGNAARMLHASAGQVIRIIPVV
jgi:S-adenosylmethionine hydrolase